MISSEVILTIVIPTYNKEKYLEKCLNSIIMQETDYEYGIVICDDASTDSTIDIIRKYQQKYKNIALLRSNINQGLFKNITRIYKELKSKYFTVLDPDDYWIDVKKIDKALNFLEKNIDYTIYFGNTLLVQDNRRESLYIKNNKIKQFDFQDYLKEKARLGHTSSTFFRNIFFNHFPNFPGEDGDSYRGDSFRNIFHIYYGKAYYSGEIDSVYNITKEGIWTSQGIQMKNLLNCCFFYDMFYLFKKKHIELLFFSYRIFLESGYFLDIIMRKDLNKLLKIQKMYEDYQNNILKLEETRKKYLKLKYKILIFFYNILQKKLKKKGLI